MINILVTGSKGFIGKNLIVHLKRIEGTNIFEYDIDTPENKLFEYLSNSNIIYHLAGVNRPKEISGFNKGNKELTEKIITNLIKNKKNIPIILSSSTQAEVDNPYGKSKLAAEQSLHHYKENGGKAYIYRLPNVFGKWCKPNYNSVVATFCYNIANNLDIQINDPNHELTLVYIDDIISEFIRILKSKKYSEEIFYSIPISHKITLGKLAEIIYEIHDNRRTLIIPDLSDPLVKKLHSTYLSYLATDNFSYNLDLKTDNRGSLFELVKSFHSGQIFISTTNPGITRGNHYHHSKNEKFVVLKGEAEIKFRHILDHDNIIKYIVSGDDPEVVDIPTGYTHSITNTGSEELITLFWANEPFNPDEPDTYFEQVERK